MQVIISEFEPNLTKILVQQASELEHIDGILIIKDEMPFFYARKTQDDTSSRGNLFFDELDSQTFAIAQLITSITDVLRELQKKNTNLPLTDTKNDDSDELPNEEFLCFLKGLDRLENASPVELLIYNSTNPNMSILLIYTNQGSGFKVKGQITTYTSFFKKIKEKIRHV